MKMIWNPGGLIYPCSSSTDSNWGNKAASQGYEPSQAVNFTTAILFFFASGSLVEGGKIVVVGNGFLKKDNRDYRRAVELAERIKLEYFAELAQPDPDNPAQL